MRHEAYIIVLPTNEAGEITAPVKIEYEYEEAEYAFHKDLYIYIDNPTGIDEDFIVKQLRQHYSDCRIEHVEFKQHKELRTQSRTARREESERAQRIGF